MTDPVDEAQVALEQAERRQQRMTIAAQGFRTLLMLAGLIAVCVGFGMVFVPAGVVAAGVLLVALPLAYVRVMRG